MKNITKITTFFICTSLFIGCATTNFVSQRNEPVKRTMLSEEVTYDNSKYSFDNPVVSITFRKKTIVRTDYNTIKLYRKERDATKSILGYIVGGTLTITGLTFLSNTDSTSNESNKYKTTGLSLSLLGLGIGVSTYLLGKSGDREEIFSSNETVATDSLLIGKKINVYTQNGFVKYLILDKNGSISIIINDYITDVENDVNFKITPVDYPNISDEFIITSDFLKGLNKYNQDRIAQAAEYKRLEKERKKIEIARAREELLSIKKLVRKQYSLKKSKTLYSKGAMWYLMRVEELSKITGGEQIELENELTLHLQRVVYSQALLMSYGPVNVLVFCKKTGFNDLCTYQKNLMGNLLKAFNYSGSRCQQMLTEPTIEQSIVDLMRERVIAEKEKRLDDYRFGIENSLGVGLRRDLEYASPND